MEYKTLFKFCCKKVMIPFFVIALMGASGVQFGFSAETVHFQKEIHDQLEMPVDMAVMDEHLYILDQKMSRVAVFNKEGEFLYSFGEYGSRMGKMKEPTSMAVSKFGELIVVDKGNKRVNVYAANGEFLYQLGGEGKADGLFVEPIQVEVDPFGYMYILDQSEKKISKFSPKGVFFNAYMLGMKPDHFMFNQENRMYVLFKEEGMMRAYDPHGHKTEEVVFTEDQIPFIKEVASFSVDQRGDFYFMDESDYQIIKMDREGHELLSFGSKGKARGQFMNAAIIKTFGEDLIYIADAKNARVQILSVHGSDKDALVEKTSVPPLVDFDGAIAAGNSITDLEVHASGLFALLEEQGYILKNADGENDMIHIDVDRADRFQDPKSLFLSDEGRLYVADTGNHRLAFLHQDGTYDYDFGEKGSNTGQFYGLSGVAMNKQGFIYVADTLNHRIQVFNGDGIYLYSIGNKMAKAAEDGTAPIIFDHPTVITFDTEGQLYVLDKGTARIRVLSEKGEWLRDIGGEQSSLTLREPVDFSLDENNYMYIADRGDHRIKIVDPQGDPVMEFGSRGMGPSYFPKLSAVAAQDGKIYVADYLVPDIKVFHFDRHSDGKSLVKKEDGIDVMEVKKDLVEIEEVKLIKEVVQEDSDQIKVPDMTLEKAQTMMGHDTMRYKISHDGTKLFATIISFPLEGVVMEEEAQWNAARKVAIDIMNKELAAKIGVALEAVMEYISVESEERMENGGFKLTVSVPKEILFRKYKEAKTHRDLTQQTQDKI